MTTPENLKQRFYKSSLQAFIARAFLHLNPGAKYLHNWHIDAISEHLNACEKKEIKRLIINLPPRSLKSVAVSVAWPAWLLGREPSRKIICASYAKSLALQHSLDSKRIMGSGWYNEIYNAAEIGNAQNQKEKFATTRNGFRMATSVGASLIGEGADFLIADDPQNPRQAASELQRDQTINWFEGSFLTRLNSKRDGVVVLVMQRLHEMDLSGYLLQNRKDQWHHLKIPALSEGGSTISMGNFSFYREHGEPLHAEREDIGVLERLKMELGSYEFEAQYQQNPVPREGGFIKSIWFERYKSYPAEAKIIQSWDTGIKVSEKADPSCLTTWAITDNAFYLLEVFREKLEYPDLKRTANNHAQKWKPEVLLIEDKASGQSLIQDLRCETTLPVIAITPRADKVSRLSSVLGVLESGRVKLPNHAPWLADFETELFSFPSSAHDDQVDSMSQMLLWIRDCNAFRPMLREI